MNDFTKEELRHLDHCLEQFKFSCMNEEFENKTSVLRLKIQSMIDSYCEHEFYLIGCGDEMFAQCHKCGNISKVVRNE